MIFSHAQVHTHPFHQSALATELRVLMYLPLHEFTNLTMAALVVSDSTCAASASTFFIIGMDLSTIVRGPAASRVLPARRWCDLTRV